VAAFSGKNHGHKFEGRPGKVAQGSTEL